MKATRQSFGESLARLGESHPEIVVLDADLAKSTKSELFAKKFPSRFFEMGISEANMIGVASGLAFRGKLPFLCSFGCFLTGRYDTIRLSSAYSQANVRLIGTHAGVGIGDDGHSQMGLEDLTLMRALPTMGVFQPMDDVETGALMDFLVKTWKGPAYLRLTRQNLPRLTPEGEKWEPLKIHKVRSSGGATSSKRVTLLGTGAGTAEAVKAMEILTPKLPTHAIEVWNVHSLKPFDSMELLEIADRSDLLVSVEDHTVIGGLGSTIAEVLSESLGKKPPLLRIGVQDLFGQSGEANALYEAYGISGQKISEKVLTLLARSS